MIAIIKTGGKQYKVKEKDIIKVEKLGKKEGNEVVFKDVLLVSDEAAKKVSVGTPKVKGAEVTAKVLEEKKDKKIMVIKYKSKVRYRRKRGHRQWYTKLRIEKISA
ncbi:MAG: 50S ribosomal protein L21 [Candidatus Kerfeldbacteria bacterium CG08_land_8_20_14_0_20_40_16]|uniref:Large ribosomal subunit protein bL21 n=1 Tax=Candidatus Kerfeldbacteria bacterium CG08_land_8_20_14_0_20_40_16 TaxID=2014244 RepID=A0A2H0YUV0_9BACT|nr:MAG: 50S ribosomal protein L21 [Candidatus Kerfeldbacteria bacterium CG08_land_8_20_14_0_20_40_16]